MPKISSCYFGGRLTAAVVEGEGSPSRSTATNCLPGLGVVGLLLWLRERAVVAAGRAVPSAIVSGHGPSPVWRPPVNLSRCCHRAANERSENRHFLTVPTMDKEPGLETRVLYQNKKETLLLFRNARFNRHVPKLKEKLTRPSLARRVSS